MEKSEKKKNQTVKKNRLKFKKTNRFSFINLKSKKPNWKKLEKNQAKPNKPS
jgi:hypothetical protein